MLGVALASTLRERAAWNRRETAVIKSLGTQDQSLQAQVANLEGQLEKERNQNSSLIQTLQKELVQEPRVPAAGGARPDGVTARAVSLTERGKEPAHIASLMAWSVSAC